MSTQAGIRAQVALWAFAYEIMNDSIVSDAVYDTRCLEVDLSVTTNRPDLDEWFKGNFQPYTGAWVHAHPEKIKLASLYERLRGIKSGMEELEMAEQNLPSAPEQLKDGSHFAMKCRLAAIGFNVLGGTLITKKGAFHHRFEGGMIYIHPTDAKCVFQSVDGEKCVDLREALGNMNKGKQP